MVVLDIRLNVDAKSRIIESERQPTGVLLMGSNQLSVMNSRTTSITTALFYFIHPARIWSPQNDQRLVRHARTRLMASRSRQSSSYPYGTRDATPPHTMPCHAMPRRNLRRHEAIQAIIVDRIRSQMAMDHHKISRDLTTSITWQASPCFP